MLSAPPCVRFNGAHPDPHPVKRLTPLPDPKHDDPHASGVPGERKQQNAQRHVRPVLHWPVRPVRFVQAVSDEPQNQVNDIQREDGNTQQLVMCQGKRRD